MKRAVFVSPAKLRWLIVMRKWALRPRKLRLLVTIKVRGTAVSAVEIIEAIAVIEAIGATVETGEATGAAEVTEALAANIQDIRLSSPSPLRRRGSRSGEILSRC